MAGSIQVMNAEFVVFISEERLAWRDKVHGSINFCTSAHGATETSTRSNTISNLDLVSLISIARNSICIESEV
jgi:hypothetical protein